VSEVIFVIKSLILAVALTVVLQIEIGQESIENRAEFWLHTSTVPRYLQDVADGAVKAVKNASKYASDVINSPSSKSIGNNQRASR
jgi:hypothetical protein